MHDLGVYILSRVWAGTGECNQWLNVVPKGLIIGIVLGCPTDNDHFIVYYYKDDHSLVLIVLSYDHPCVVAHELMHTNY